MTVRGLRRAIAELRRAPRDVLIAEYVSRFGRRPPAKRRGYLRLALVRELETELARRGFSSQPDDEIPE